MLSRLLFFRRIPNLMRCIPSKTTRFDAVLLAKYVLTNHNEIITLKDIKQLLKEAMLDHKEVMGTAQRILLKQQ